MIDYSVMDNVNVFVELSGFIHPTSRRVLLVSSKRTASTLDRFLVFSGDDPCYARITPPYDHVCRVLLKQRTEISESRCLATTTRSSIHRMLLVGQIRRSPCEIVGPRATARNATHTKTSQRNKPYTSLFFDTTYMYIAMLYV